MIYFKYNIGWGQTYCTQILKKPLFVHTYFPSLLWQKEDASIERPTNYHCSFNVRTLCIFPRCTIFSFQRNFLSFILPCHCKPLKYISVDYVNFNSGNVVITFKFQVIYLFSCDFRFRGVRHTNSLVKKSIWGFDMRGDIPSFWICES